MPYELEVVELAARQILDGIARVRSHSEREAEFKKKESAFIANAQSVDVRLKAREAAVEANEKRLGKLPQQLEAAQKGWSEAKLAVHVANDAEKESRKRADKAEGLLAALRKDYGTLERKNAQLLLGVPVA